MKPECAIIGGGIVGALTTWRLALRGVNAIWFSGSPEVEFSPASHAAGAMLCPISEIDESESDEEISASVSERLRARKVYDSLFEELDISTESVNWRSGIALIASAKYRERDLRQIAWQTRIASSFGQPTQALSSEDLSFLSPHQDNAIVGGIMLNMEASFDVLAFLRLVKNRIEDLRNVVIDHRLVTSVLCKSDTSEITVVTKSGAVSFPRVILAAGVATFFLLEKNTFEAAALLPLFGGKGVSLRGTVHLNPPFAVRTPNRGFACGLHIVPNANGVLYLGATNRLVTDRTFTKCPLLEEVTQLLRGATRDLSTDFERMQIASFYTGYRPVTLDHRPVVGSTACPGIMVATGTWRNGVLFAPLLAEMLAAEFCDQKPSYMRFSPFRKFSTFVPDDATLTMYAEDLLESDTHHDQMSKVFSSQESAMIKHKLGQVFDIATSPTSAGVARARRLWKRAPMREVVPSVWKLLTEK